MLVDKFGSMSDTKTKDTGVSLTYINNNYIRSDGTTPVSGSIDMRGNTLYNVPDPVNPQDVATKEYADKKTNIIAVSTNYCGDLIYGEYQFAFGGKTCKEVGFLIPHSGRIKKIKFRMVGGVEAYYRDVKPKDPEPIGTFVVGELFSIMLFKKDEVLDPTPNPEGSIFEDGAPITESILGTYDCTFVRGVIGDAPDSFRRRCDFTYSLKNHSLSEGDYINIRSEKTIEKTKEKFSYMFTFLIELDPL